MTDQNAPSIDEMLNWDTPRLASALASLQETRLETKIVTCRTEDPDPGAWDSHGWGYWNDKIEYAFERGLSEIPESLSSYLKRGGPVRERLVEAATYLKAHSKEIAINRGLRGPLPIEKGWPEKYDHLSHFHYQPEHGPPEEMTEQLLDNTKQSLEEYAERILQS